TPVCATSPPPAYVPPAPKGPANGNGSAAKEITSSPKSGMPEPGFVDTKPPADPNQGTPIPPPRAPGQEKDDSPPAGDPPPGVGVGAAGGANVVRHAVAKPKANEFRMQPATQVKPLLLGKVTSGANATPVASAKVVLTNPSGRFEKKTFTS